MILPFTEEVLISFVDTFYGVLEGLGRKITHPRMSSVLHFGYVTHQCVHTQSLPEQLVVPSVHCYAIVPKNSERVYAGIEISTLGVAIELVLIG